jgi:hypothetical protein
MVILMTTVTNYEKIRLYDFVLIVDSDRIADLHGYKGSKLLSRCITNDSLTDG